MYKKKITSKPLMKASKVADKRICMALKYSKKKAKPIKLK